jgi:hypothetical protein
MHQPMAPNLPSACEPRQDAASTSSPRDARAREVGYVEIIDELLDISNGSEQVTDAAAAATARQRIGRHSKHAASGESRVLRNRRRAEAQW